MVHIFDESQFPHSVDAMSFEILCRAMRLPMSFVNKATLVAIADHDNLHLLKTTYLNSRKQWTIDQLPMIIELHMPCTKHVRKEVILDCLNTMTIK